MSPPGKTRVRQSASLVLRSKTPAPKGILQGQDGTTLFARRRPDLSQRGNGRSRSGLLLAFSPKAPGRVGGLSAAGFAASRRLSEARRPLVVPFLAFSIADLVYCPSQRPVNNASAYVPGAVFVLAWLARAAISSTSRSGPNRGSASGYAVSPRTMPQREFQTWPLRRISATQGRGKRW